MASGPTKVLIPMPQLGVSVEEGTVVGWHKAVGDSVGVDEALCDISTDKVDTEVRSPDAGLLLRIIAGVGVTVSIGAPLAEIAVGDVAGTTDANGLREGTGGAASSSETLTNDDADAARSASDASAGVRGQRVAESGSSVTASGPPQGAAAVIEAIENGVNMASRTRRIVSPVARRLAADRGVSVESLTGTGLAGRITKADVLAVTARLEVATASAQTSRVTHATSARDLPQTAASQPFPATNASASVSDGPALPRGYQDVPHTLTVLSHQRRAIAEHMIRSRQTAAHMTTEVEVDMSAVATARDELNTGRSSSNRISYLAFIARAACLALALHPDLNATFTEEHLVRWGEVNLGIAVDTPAGLLVPVIRHAERLTAVGVADAVAELAERARARQLTPDDVRAGTFTITNPGSVGAVSSMAIINQPQVAILGTPAIVRRPVVVNDARGGESIAIRPIMQLALTFDHRAVDGAEATRFLVKVKNQLESWQTPAYA